MENFGKLWEEFLEDNEKIDFSSFELKKTLHPKFWGRLKTLNPDIAKKLVQISEDFIKNLDLDINVIEDILFTGSLAYYNWSKYSDIDLHILVDFKSIDENTDLVKEYFNGRTFIWNSKHDIKIFDHEVEIYVQDAHEDHVASGVYSIIDHEWRTEPINIEPKIDYTNLEKKASYLIDCIDRLYDLYEDQKYKDVHEIGKKFKQKVRNMRKTGLEGAGIFSTENLAFKVLRRNGYLGRLNDLIDKSYDSLLSLNKNFEKKLHLYVSEPKNEENKGFNAINELERFQKRVAARHSRLKRVNIGLGGQKNTPPYNHGANYNRSESSPPAGE
jgi:hypothetical protein